MTYWLLNLVFLAFVLLVLVFLRRYFKTKPVVQTMFVLLLLTALFDNLIIYTGIVDYDPEKISGIKIFVAPIEDFAYTVAAVLMLPTIWTFLRRQK